LPASLVKCAAAGTSQHQPKATTRSGALVLVLGCQLMIVLDGTMIYMALPLIRADLGLSTTLLSWVQNAYMLAVGGFLLLGARASDLIGQRRVFVAANASFIAASVAAGLASSALWLVGARGMQGLAAAFAAPSAFALLMTLFPEGPVRTRAIGLFTAVSGGGSALGLVLGGAFAQFYFVAGHTVCQLANRRDARCVEPALASGCRASTRPVRPCRCAKRHRGHDRADLWTGAGCA